MAAPDRFQVVMGRLGVRLWSHDRELPSWAKDDGVTEYVRADVVADLYAALTEARTTLSIARTQVMVELNRGAERWEGVPEVLRDRLAAIDAALAKASPSARSSDGVVKIEGV